MMTPQNYAVFITTADTRIGQIFSEISPAETHSLWSTVAPMTEGSIWVMAWTGKMPKARPWYGSRVLHEPTLQTYSVSPVPYELTVGIDQFRFDDASAAGQNVFWRMLPDVATQWRKQPEYELRDLLEARGVYGTTDRQQGLDGLPYFNTGHPIDIYAPTLNFGGLFTGGTYRNDFIGGASIDSQTIGGALSESAISSLAAYMRMIPGDDGEVLGVTPSAVMVPPTLETVGKIILQAQFYSPPSWGVWSPLTGQVGAADNMLAKMGMQLIVNPFLKNTRNWYMMDLTHANKPMWWVVREAATQVPRMSPSDPIVFDSHRYTWGGWDRVAPAWSFPWLMMRSGPTP